MKVNTILDLIGKTPVVKINRLFNNELDVWVKLEKQNPGGSIKDRIALAMVEDAEKSGVLTKNTPIIEPTSGNTGIGLALVAAVKGYKIILVMPESMSLERRRLVKAYGAELVLTPKEKGMKGAIDKATELQKELNGWVPMQFENSSNPNIHAKTTAQEIIDDFPEGIDYLISGVGTGGHISGVARVLKAKWPNIKVFAVEPDKSPVIGGGNPGPHALQGIGAGFIPKNLDTSLLDGTIKVSKDDAFNYSQKVVRQEGLFVGISSGASLAAIAKKLPEIKGKRVLTFAYDTGERYLSVEGLF